MILRWESIDLTISEVSDGLIITQCGESYLAKHWELSNEVISVIDKAIEHGLTCLIRHSHPKKNNRLPANKRGVKYIGFSQFPEESWVFVLDRFPVKRRTSNRIAPTQVTFEKHYRGVLMSAGITIADESGGGQNSFVPIHELEPALEACGAKEREEVELAIGSRDWKRVAESIGFVREDMLERWMVEEWRTLPFGNQLILVRNQFPANGYLDILAEDKKTKSEIIFELKRSTANRKVIENQLTQYVECRRQNANVVWGAVVARNFSAEALAAAKEADFPLQLYRFHHVNGRFRLEKIWGDWRAPYYRG